MRSLGRIDSIASVLEGLVRRLGLESKLLENRLHRDWGSIVGEPVASNTWPDQIRYKKLYILVRNSIWLHQLTFLKPSLMQKLKDVDGKDLITDIVLRVGELPVARHVSTSPETLRESSASEALIAEIAAHVTTIQDPVLRERIARLMAQVLAQPQAPRVG